MKMSRCFAVVMGVAALVAGMVLSGCDFGGGGDSVSRNVDINVQAVYLPATDVDTIVLPASAVSGSAPYFMNLLQSGDNLEGIDDHGLVFRGNINQVIESATLCSFTLTGKTSLDVDVTITGTITISGDAALMEGTWIEPNSYAVVYGVGAAPVQQTNTTALTASASPTSITRTGTSTLTASGGDGSYTWAISGTSYGSLSTTSGSTSTFTASTTTNGTQAILVTSGSSSVTVSIVITE